MNEAFSTAGMLLAVGMITVFTILLLIVVFGNILIALVNRFIPEVEMVKAVKSHGHAAMDPRKVAAIVSAVDIVTEGKAKVTSITKAG
jgi:oxaloacetate decarboxylase (Na+ extruding) subunit gamma